MSKSKKHQREIPHILTYRAILFFWLPLAFSWLLMTFEGPWVQGVISRKADAELQLAAFGLVMSLSVTIEAPIIMLLATGNALSRDNQAFKVLWRFMMVLNILLTGLALLMAFTPLLDVYLGDILGIPLDIIEATRPGMAIMILWTAFIGYRRFHQGIMIARNHTREISYGTMIRIVTSGSVALFLGAFTETPGAQIGAWSLICAVAAEVFYIYRASRDDVNDLLEKSPADGIAPMTYRDIMRFHMPLALTSVLTLFIRPVLESGLASTPDAKEALAAWPIIFSIFLVMRSGAFAWQEVVISLSRNAQKHHKIRQFTRGLAATLTAFIIIFSFTPLIDFYIGTILGIPEAIRPAVIIGTQAGILLPLCATIQSYYRALLMLADNTSPVYQAMGLGFAMTVGVMWLGLQLQFPGVMAASLSLTIGTIAELVYLWRTFIPQQSKLKARWALEAGSIID
ncbi:MAG: hypothetical protein ACPG7F_07600 [Aggregatilineales bacterium]